MSPRSSPAPTDRSEGPAIEVLDLTRVWPQPGGPPVRAVDGARFDVAPGEVMGLLGPNGAGKSTLMQVLATLTPPTEGTARVAGHDVRTAPDQVRAHLGYLSTTSGLPTRLRARECLRLFARLQGLPDPKAAAEEAIETFRLADFAERQVEGLSTGMRQRVRIACAAVHKPPVLVLDEPTAGLDLMSTDELLDEVSGLRDQGAAVLYSTHIMHEVTRLCDRVTILVAGEIKAVDTIPGLLERTGADDLPEAFRRCARDGCADPDTRAPASPDATP